MSEDTVINVTMEELKGEDETLKFRDGQREIQPVADKLIGAVDSIRRLRNFEIKYLFAKDELTSKGKRVLGKACKFGEKDRLLHRWNFLIIIDENFWKTYPDKREPLVLHELLHCGQNDEGNPTMLPHDLEEFGEVVRRYGGWATDVVMFDRQLELFAQGRKEAVHE
jgi:hypothetical protein